MKAIIIILFFLTVLIPSGVKAVDWSRVIDLTGSWSFTVGDDSNWAKPTSKTDDWEKINVPGKWESYYPGYNGYAWYRKEFDIKVMPGNGALTLLLGKIDDVDEVFINGVKVGQTGSFFPDYRSAYDVERSYPIPDGLLKPGKNIIAVRVYDECLEGGMVSGRRIGIYFDNDSELVCLDLSGSWKFSVYRQRDFYKKEFDDKNWAEINVPGKWESQGYPSHNGYGWYRKQFILPSSMNNGTYYLVLGKIDDLDKVYLNGKLIGRTEDLPKYLEYNKSLAWQFYRAYPIPKGLLQRSNILAVEVYDNSGDGGIYEGPVGLADLVEAQALLYRKVENENNNVFWSVLKYIFD